MIWINNVEQTLSTAFEYEKLFDTQKMKSPLFVYLADNFLEHVRDALIFVKPDCCSSEKDQL